MDRDVTAINVQELLDRLDPRLDEACTVPGCSHGHRGTPVTPDVLAGLRAA